MARSLFAILNRRYGPREDAVTRREMLQATLAIGAASLISARVGFPVAAGPAPRPRATAAKRVVVVGAGLAGLAAAYELVAAGYEVVVVEARARIGGRVVTFADLVPGKTVDGGGEMIGRNHPTWLAYRERFKLELYEIKESEDEGPLVLNGKKLAGEENEKLWKELKEVLPRMDADAAKVDADMPWKSPDAAALDNKTTANWIAGLKTSADCRAAVRAQLEGDNGVAVEKQSYLGNLAAVKGGGLEKFWTDSEAFRCKGGTHALALKFAEALGDKRVRLGASVAGIQIRDKGAKVKLAAGDVLECDDVVLTAPPATWGKIAFDPPLPVALRPQSGPAIKFLAAVEKRFWKDSKQAADGLTDGPISWTWESTAGQEGEAGACLTAFSGGPAAEACRAFPADARVEKYLGELSRLYPDLRKSFKTSKFVDWPADGWAGSGYSFPAPGEIMIVGPVLHGNVGGRLHFAGEHASYAFIGYMEGALSSGVRVAKGIAVRDGAAKEK